MNLVIKKSFITLSIVATTMMPIRSHAALGSFSQAPHIMVLGAAISVISISRGISVIMDAESIWGVIGGLAIGAAGAYSGLIIMDKDSEISLTTLSDVQGNNLELSEEEVSIFNSEIEEANAIFKTITAETVNEDLNAKEITQRWIDYSDYLSPETFTVIQAIATQR